MTLTCFPRLLSLPKRPVGFTAPPEEFAGLGGGITPPMVVADFVLTSCTSTFLSLDQALDRDEDGAEFAWAAIERGEDINILGGGQIQLIHDNSRH